MRSKTRPIVSASFMLLNTRPRLSTGCLSGVSVMMGLRVAHPLCISPMQCPFFHGQLALLPMLELALLQVDEHLSLEKGGLQIVGYYHANERFDDDDLNLVARKIGDHVIRFFPQAVILLLDNKRLASLLKNESLKSILQLYLRDANRIWKQAGQVGSASGELALKDSTANNLLVSYILEGRDKKVVDFDEHLDDVTKDWLNRKLFD